MKSSTNATNRRIFFHADVAGSWYSFLDRDDDTESSKVPSTPASTSRIGGGGINHNLDRAGVHQVWKDNLVVPNMKLWRFHRTNHMEEHSLTSISSFFSNQERKCWWEPGQNPICVVVLEIWINVNEEMYFSSYREKNMCYPIHRHHWKIRIVANQIF